MTAGILLTLAHGSSHAQRLKLRSLSIPADVQPGRWVAFQASIQSHSRPARWLTQRLAIVAKEGLGEESGVWAELKTTEAGRTRIERGFFGRGAHDDEEGSAAGRGGTESPLSLLRYQVLASDGKLYEYPIYSEGIWRLDEDISAMDIIEFMPTRSQDRDSLGPDTLRVGRKVVPCRVERVRRYGSEDWSDADTSYVNRAVMTRTVWWNPAIPVTGYARSVLEVSWERVGVAAEAPGDSAASAAPGDSAASAAPSDGSRLLFRVELTLLDLGDGAVPEVTQEPEPAPEESAPQGSEGFVR